MILKSFVLLFVFFTSGIKSAQLEYTYNNISGGWLKFHKPTTWIDASILYEIEDQSSKTCLTWEKGNAELTSKCNEKLPYVCYKSQKEEAPECGTPDTEYIYDKRSGSCYKFHRQGTTWSEAYKTCTAEGGYLAIINSPLESVVLKELFANNPENIRNCLSQTNPAFSFIGIRDWLDGESWRSVKGQSLTDVGFMGWASGEPNNDHGGIEHCISITRSGTYNDYCCVSLLTFICEKEPKPECY